MKKTLLLIDDQEAFGETVAMVLQGRYRLVHCITFAQAREALKGEQIDIIFLDVSMSDGSGINFIPEIKSSGCWPIVLCTAVEDPYCIAAAFKKGVSDYIGKPFPSNEMLLETIREHIGE